MPERRCDTLVVVVVDGVAAALAARGRSVVLSEPTDRIDGVRASRAGASGSTMQPAPSQE